MTKLRQRMIRDMNFADLSVGTSPRGLQYVEDDIPVPEIAFDGLDELAFEALEAFNQFCELWNEDAWR
jgi:hypothetical protein